MRLGCISVCGCGAGLPEIPVTTPPRAVRRACSACGAVWEVEVVLRASVTATCRKAGKVNKVEDVVMATAELSS